MKNNYISKWMLQRVTAIILIPLSFWFIYNCISFQKLQYFELQLFFKSYLNSSLFIVMMTSMIFHAKLGCETIIQDYIVTFFYKKFLKIMINLISLFSLFSVILAIFKLSIYQ